MKEEILSTETIFDGRIVHLQVQTVRLPDDSETKREVVKHRGAVAVVAVDDEDMILLVKQYRIAIQQVTIEIPAGILEPNESPVDAAIREMQEETGYRPLNMQEIGGLHVAPGYTSEYIHLYYADGYEYEPLQQDGDEFVEHIRIPFTEAQAMVTDGRIHEGKSLVGILKVAQMRNK